MLIRLARLNDAPVFSDDPQFIANARSEGLRVIVPSEIDRALHPPITPGQSLRVFIEKAGENEGQGLAHLSDGSLVIVKGGEDKVGSNVQVTIQRFHHTAQGRMIFADFEGMA